MNNSQAPQRVLIEITHQVWVDVVEPGQDRKALDVDPATARALVADAIQKQDWGGYSMLGNALKLLDPWKATRIEVVGREGLRLTQQEILRERTRAQRMRWAFERVLEQHGEALDKLKDM